ncbi:DUF4012 domain-containing protein [Pseudarthrobacter sp. NPDC092184]|uniref:DUF4012 domain-containing protein n=1 Tax=unclassified Pseudarthrobacter TaxID=2647000 RepID=UPI003802F667
MTSEKKKRTRRRLIYWVFFPTVLVGLIAVALTWLSFKGSLIKEDLQAASNLVGQLQEDLTRENLAAATATSDLMGAHTASARRAANDPLWILASSVPGLGVNFEATTQIATSADDIAQLGVRPLVSVYSSMDWDSLTLGDSPDLSSFAAAEPRITSAAHAVRQSSERLARIDEEPLLPQIASPLREARAKLSGLRTGLDVAESVVQLAPDMMGAQGARNYLLLIQNNAESRATGGIPGALAVLGVDNGKIKLEAQKSAAELGSMSPAIQVDPMQQSIYSTRLGKYMQDVNLTPDFPTAANTAQSMWLGKTGQPLDGVVSIDPVALSYILEATGPVSIKQPEQATLAGSNLPEQLSSGNFVQTVLSDTYREIEDPKLQDAYFARVAEQIFASISSGDVDSKVLLQSLTRGVSEGRVLLWSRDANEQALISRYSISGSINGTSVQPAEFGVYFNDGTGAKMDYYVKRTVQLIKECPRDGYEETTVRITSTNTAPGDAATSLPPYVTGDGNFGVPPGSVQTNIVAYGPAQAHVETAKLDGQKSEFAPYFHGNRPVGVLAIRLAPGESKTVDFTFGKIVQHTEPNVVVTPTVQDVKDVTLPTESVACG